MGYLLCWLTYSLIIRKIKYLNQQNLIISYFGNKYVYDVLACFIGSDKELEVFLHFRNNLHSDIKFTIKEMIELTF